jgi:hypothetical protein
MPKLFVGYIPPAWTLNKLVGIWEGLGLLEAEQVFTSFNAGPLSPHMGYTKNGQAMWMHIHVATREVAYNLIKYYHNRKTKIDGRVFEVNYYKRNQTKFTLNQAHTAPSKYEPAVHYE